MSARIIRHLSKADATLGRLMRAAGPYRLVPDLDCEPFQALARAIAHQQLNGIAANTILKRFIAACGAGGFPTPQAVLAAPDDTLRAAGFSFAKITSLKDLATKTLEGVVPERKDLLNLADGDIIARLTQVRGIGRWTVEMLLIFQLGRPDVLPVDDFGVRSGFRLAYGLRKLPAPKALAAFGERWAPHRTAAAWYLWRANELARAGTLPEPQETVRLPRLRRGPQESARLDRRTAHTQSSQAQFSGVARRAVRTIAAHLKKAKRRKASLAAAKARQPLRKATSRRARK